MYMLTDEDLQVLGVASDYLINVSYSYCHPLHPNSAEWNGVCGAGIEIRKLVNKLRESVNEETIDY